MWGDKAKVQEMLPEFKWARGGDNQDECSVLLLCKGLVTDFNHSSALWQLRISAVGSHKEVEGQVRTDQCVFYCFCNPGVVGRCRKITSFNWGKPHYGELSSSSSSIFPWQSDRYQALFRLMKVARSFGAWLPVSGFTRPLWLAGGGLEKLAVILN